MLIGKNNGGNADVQLIWQGETNHTPRWSQLIWRGIHQSAIECLNSHILNIAEARKLFVIISNLEMHKKRRLSLLQKVIRRILVENMIKEGRD